MFCLLAPSLNHDSTRALFGDLDFSQFVIVVDGPHQCHLHHKILDFDIDEVMYLAIRNYLCHVHNMTPRRNKKAGNANTRKIMLEDAQEELRKAKSKKQKSVLRPVISTLINYEGFKYNLEEIKEMK